MEWYKSIRIPEYLILEKKAVSVEVNRCWTQGHNKILRLGEVTFGLNP